MIETRLKDLREDHDYTQEQLAKYLHVSQPTYCDYENEKINIPIEVFIKLARFYHTNIEYITKCTNESKPLLPRDLHK